MTPEQYRIQAHAMALPSTSLEYVTLGLGEEAGEVVGKVKRILRGETITPSSILIECGDVLWYAAEICYRLGIDFAKLAQRVEMSAIAPPRASPLSFYTSPVSHYAAHLLKMTTTLMSLLDSGEQIEGAMFLVLLDIRNICFVCDFSLEDAMEANIKKLEDRKARNQLLGQGDNR